MRIINTGLSILNRNVFIYEFRWQLFVRNYERDKAVVRK
jgi:hypothetical protein